ncbi:MAG: HYExAFE family protein [Planctomycetaceae bacterium]|nr:HYExAFE family protein [Planctomycetaceae bacterium]
MDGGNHYERAFQCWLKDNGVQYLAVDQHKRTAFSRCKIKSFDFLFYTAGGRAVIAEVKGRKFAGKNFSAFGTLPNWVTDDDITGLENWIRIFSSRYEGLFIFAYDLENIDVETDGREIYDCLGRRYVFMAVRLADYLAGATLRSIKWKTLHLSAEYFKKCSFDVNEMVLRTHIRTTNEH